MTARKNLFNSYRQVTYVDSRNVAHTSHRYVHFPLAMHDKPYVWIGHTRYEVYAQSTDINNTQYTYEVYAAVPSKVGKS